MVNKGFYVLSLLQLSFLQLNDNYKFTYNQNVT